MPTTSQPVVEVALYAAPFLLAVVLATVWRLSLTVSVLIAMTLMLPFAQHEPAPWDVAAMVWLVMLGLRALAWHDFEIDSRYLVLCAGFICLNVLVTLYWYARGDYYQGLSSGMMRFGGASCFLCLCSLGFIESGKHPGTMRSVLNAFVAACALVAGLGLFEYLATGMGRYRAMATLKDPNVYAALLAAGLLIVIAQTLVTKKLRLAQIALMALLSAGMLVSFSRGAVVNVLAGIAYMMLATRQRARTLITVLVACTALFIAVHYFDQQGFMVERISTHDSNSEQYRWVALREGWSQIVAHPAGIGPGQFENRVSVILPSGETPLASHDTLLRVFSELGVEGLALWLLLTGVPLLRCWSYRRHRVAELQFTALASGAVLTGCALQGLVLDTIHWRHLWMFMGIALALTQQARQFTSASSKDTVLPTPLYTDRRSNWHLPEVVK